MTNTETYERALELSQALEKDIYAHPQNHILLTGDRPTGRLHIGHYFGSLVNRIELSNIGVKTYIVIADYQVLTDHDAYSAIKENAREIVMDYISSGLLPGQNIVFFPHSCVPELNQLMLPFLTLVSSGELERNPTVKEEIAASGMTSVNAGMYTYPVHQACDILFCKGTVVPVGKDQLPHLEMTRLIARRFNEKYGGGAKVFPEPYALLSKSPMLLGLDGSQKMSKSRNNAIMLSATEDETAVLIKKAKTDSGRVITWDPENRPEVSNLLLIISLCTGEEPEAIAARIGDGGGGALKTMLTETLNEKLRPIRAERKRLEADPGHILNVIKEGVAVAREAAQKTLDEVRSVMNMDHLSG
jgi:tryptophanyl-tRNA synthetase